jgi:putative flippase GtrA
MLPAILSRENRVQLFKYCLVSVGGYAFIMFMMYLLVDLIRVPAGAAFIVTYAMAYASEYYLNLKLLFLRKHSWIKVLKFCIHIAVFISIGSAVFAILLKMHIHYLAATICTAVVLLPARFAAHKFIVFR